MPGKYLSGLRPVKPDFTCLAMTTSVYCDEAGYNGDDLRQVQQPYFSYAGVAISSAEAGDIMQEIRQLLRTQAPELKGKHLYAHRLGVQGIDILVQRLAGRATFVVHNKAFALGAKFFEYALEPFLASKNAFFYHVRFHQFISNLMYMLLSSGDADAETVMNLFIELMRRPSAEAEGLFTQALGTSNDPSGMLMDIMRLVRLPESQAAIQAELDSISDEQGHIKFMLDLSVTSATSVLRHLSAQYGSLEVTLDDSKPLKAATRILNDLGAGPLKVLPDGWGDGLPFNYQLARPVQFANSALEPGLQVADLLAGVVALACRDHDKGTDRSQRVLDLVQPLAGQGCIMPSLEHLNFETDAARFNVNLLARLAARAEAGLPLLDPALLG